MKFIIPYKVGDKIRILHMEGEPQYDYRVGIITDIDNIGGIHGTWGSLAIYLEYDDIERIG